MRLYTILVQENGETIGEAHFGTFEAVKEHLNMVDYFSWLQDNEPERALPDFTDIESPEDLEAIFEEYDYGWFTVSLEIKEVI